MIRDPHSLKSLPIPEAGSAALWIRASHQSQRAAAKAAVGKIINDVFQKEKA